MQRTISIKLETSPEQRRALIELAHEFAQGCNLVARFAAERRITNRVKLHHLAYYPVRENTRLGSQMVCNAIRAVAGAYKALKANKRLPKDGPFTDIVFGGRGAVHFDKRTYSIRGETLSLYTLDGRIQVPMRLGEFQRAYLDRGIPKEAKLVQKPKGWFFHLVLDVPVGKARSGGTLGVDLGENNIAATSTGKVFGGGKLRYDRDRYLALRRRLQRNGSQSAKQLLKRISGRERRHVTHVNHEVSKAIVTEAVRVGAGVIALERLTHIRKRIKAGKRLRSRLHRWAWAQLQGMIAYKAEAMGIEVLYVNPAYSSQTCNNCGQIVTRKRHTLSCSCGNRAHSDVNAALNLARLGETAVSSRGVVNRPDVAA
ncbi:transposase [Desulfolithobacter dissulfuricans]|uniref:Transposase n=1 Tax=Desulfolithobacter dissulfuricans TaxID=2795293 RepID=A0A915U1G1_9BACT|nr:transposase [Desulfolithobacter dissulfuricans]BCO09339.1 transposase [Desulfolithobacter dissulfuricans]